MRPSAPRGNLKFHEWKPATPAAVWVRVHKVISRPVIIAVVQDSREYSRDSSVWPLPALPAVEEDKPFEMPATLATAEHVSKKPEKSGSISQLEWIPVHGSNSPEKESMETMEALTGISTLSFELKITPSSKEKEQIFFVKYP